MTKVENDGTNRRRFLLGAGLAGAGAVAAGCTGSGAESGDDSQNLAGGDGGNAKPGKEVTLGFSAPAANHGWMAAISDNARAQAKAFEDVTLDATEGTNDVNKQISAVKSLIAKKVDALVVLPFNGESLTAVAKEAMSKGIPVVNVDRIFASHLAYRTWMGGDNYGMGVNAGNFVAERLKQQGKTKNPVIIEVRGIANLPLTQDRSAGFEEALAEHGLKVTAQQAADFTPQEGRKVMGQLLQAHSHIDAVWNHDDDQGVGVLAAVEQAGRTDEFHGRRRRLEADDEAHPVRGRPDGCHRALPAHHGGVGDLARPAGRAGACRRRAGRESDPDEGNRLLGGGDQEERRPVHVRRFLTATQPLLVAPMKGR